MNVQREVNLLDQAIFKAYDIRGIYPDQLDEEAAYRIGLGFATSGLLSGDDVIIGRDMRNSSDALFSALSRGITDVGRNVIDIGQVTTPMFYFAVNVLNGAGGVMITASHNPGEYNGFKFVREQGIPISAASGLSEIKKRAMETIMPTDKKGATRRERIQERYVNFFTQRFSISFDRKVVIDTGNGMVGAILPQVLETQNIQYKDLFFTPDGNFPHHEANPLKEENLEDLRQEMRAIPSSVGVAFDGDGDRVAFLDEDGNLVRGDLLTALIASHLLDERGPSPIIYDLRSSRIVPEVIRAHGGKPVKTRVGHSFIKALMRKEKAIFAGELSFHFYFSDFFYCESGILAMLTVLKLLADSGKSLKSLIAPLRKYTHSGEINFRVTDQQAAMDAVAKRFADGEISRLDGLSVDYPDWWFNLRPSNTEPLLRLNAEANSPELLEEKLKEIKAVLDEFTV